ncbi:MAG: T9SS type A sorting domain-containing protein [Rhodothermia bacterium]|nr:T9SS type A sorting domain-containing protein [Rhodothermia bacterium]
MRSESSAFNPATGHIWVSSGNPLNLVNEDPMMVTDWVTQSWYSFDEADLTTPLAFFTWDNSLAADDTGRPRGLGFSPDGMTAYVTMFSTGGAAIQTFSPGAVGVEPVDSEIPESFSLKQNYPNPFNPTTTIEFDLRAASMAQLRVYDVLGREVAELVNEPLAAGTYKVQFDASDLSSGTYVYILETESARQSASMTILK